MLDTSSPARREQHEDKHHSVAVSLGAKSPYWAVQSLHGVDLSLRAEHMARHPLRPVSEIMSTQVVPFTAQTTIQEATQVMLERQISGAPVVDEHHKPIGIVSKTDLLEAWHEHHKSPDAAGETLVGNIMVPYLLAAQHSSPIALAAALMAYEGVHRLLVLNEKSVMVGIVTSLDILRWLGNLSGFLLAKPGPV